MTGLELAGWIGTIAWAVAGVASLWGLWTAARDARSGSLSRAGRLYRSLLYSGFLLAAVTSLPGRRGTIEDVLMLVAAGLVIGAIVIRVRAGRQDPDGSAGDV